MTRLERLCLSHSQQGGTIHQFNLRYGCDFLAMSDQEFSVWITQYERSARKGLINRRASFPTRDLRLARLVGIAEAKARCAWKPLAQREHWKRKAAAWDQIWRAEVEGVRPKARVA